MGLKSRRHEDALNLVLSRLRDWKASREAEERALDWACSEIEGSACCGHDHLMIESILTRIERSSDTHYKQAVRAAVVLARLKLTPEFIIDRLGGHNDAVKILDFLDEPIAD